MITTDVERNGGSESEGGGERERARVREEEGIGRPERNGLV